MTVARDEQDFQRLVLERLDSLAVELRSTNERIDKLEQSTNERFDKMEQSTNERFDKMEQSTNERFDRLDSDLKKEVERWDARFFEFTRNELNLTRTIIVTAGAAVIFAPLIRELAPAIVAFLRGSGAS